MQAHFRQKPQITANFLLNVVYQKKTKLNFISNFNMKKDYFIFKNYTVFM